MVLSVREILNQEALSEVGSLSDSCGKLNNILLIYRNVMYSPQ